MNYNNIIDLLSSCGVGCILINSENTIIVINDIADALLDGMGQLPGMKLPAPLIPSVQALWDKGNMPEQNERSSGRGPAGAGLLGDLLPSENTKDTGDIYTHLGFGRYVRCEAVLQHPLFPGDTRLLVLRDASRDYALDMAVTALDKIHESVVMCDEEDRMYYCNPAALEFDDLIFGRVRGELLDDVYENEDSSPMMTPLVRRTMTPSIDHRQYYHTKSGQRRETIANFFPVIRGGKSVGAFSVLEDWDTASSLQRKVIDLQDRLLSYDVLHARHSFADFVQQSAVARNTVKLCTEAAAQEQPVLLYGEIGTGKHFLAQSIHRASTRAARPFLHFACASLPHVLLDAMLFGTVRGTSPDSEDKKGLLEQAEGGTLYLSELEAMNPGLQRKLLRVMQRGVFCRIGDSTPIPLHVRFVISTSLSPDKAIEARKLDQSLYSFLQHRCVMVPPLRNRRADIIPLAMEFINEFNRKYQKHIVTVSDDVFSLFKKYRWPGNIKELKQLLNQAVSAVPGEAEILTTEYLPARITHKRPARTPLAPAAGGILAVPPADNEALKDTVTQLRRQSIYQILVKNGGNITKAAAEMGLSRQNLQYHIRQCGIDLAEIRGAAKKK